VVIDAHQTTKLTSLRPFNQKENENVMKKTVSTKAAPIWARSSSASPQPCQQLPFDNREPNDHRPDACVKAERRSGTLWERSFIRGGAESGQKWARRVTKDTTFNPASACSRRDSRLAKSRIERFGDVRAIHEK